MYISVDCHLNFEVMITFSSYDYRFRQFQPFGTIKMLFHIIKILKSGKIYLLIQELGS